MSEIESKINKPKSILCCKKEWTDLNYKYVLTVFITYWNFVCTFMTLLFQMSLKIFQLDLARSSGFHFLQTFVYSQRTQRSQQQVGSYTYSNRYGTVLLRKHFRFQDDFLPGTSVQSTEQTLLLVVAIYNLLQVSYVTVCKGPTIIFFLSF